MVKSKKRPILQPAQPRPITHGLPGTYARGCRCTKHDRLYRRPQTTGCTEAWRAYKKERRERLGWERVERGTKNV